LVIRQQVSDNQNVHMRKAEPSVSAKSLTGRASRLFCGRDQEQLAIYRQGRRVVLLYHGGGRVFVTALNRNHNQPHPPQVATCGFFCGDLRPT
jgi:hypothetical protein